MRPRRAAALLAVPARGRSASPLEPDQRASRPRDLLARPLIRVRDQMVGMERFELIALMLLLTVVLHSPGPGNSAIGIVAVAGLLFRPVTRRPALWLVLALLLAVNSALAWFDLFNHNYLILYACLAVGIALMTRDSDRALAGTSRMLLALVFLLAAFYKAISPDFPSGSFFEFTLLTDARFRDLAEVIGGMPAGAGAANADAIEDWREVDKVPGIVALVSGARIGLVADAMAIWTLFIEGLVGLLFLFARSERLSYVTEVVFLLFIGTTYVLAPVVGFGWVLLVLGLAQTRLPTRVAHVAYPALFIVLPLFALTDELWLIPRLLLTVS